MGWACRLLVPGDQRSGALEHYVLLEVHLTPVLML
jgi:hypothetical protein